MCHVVEFGVSNVGCSNVFNNPASNVKFIPLIASLIILSSLKTLLIEPISWRHSSSNSTIFGSDDLVDVILLLFFKEGASLKQALGSSRDQRNKKADNFFFY